MSFSRAIKSRTACENQLDIPHYNEITPLVTGVKSYISISPTGRNYAVSYWRKILHIRQPTGRNYAVSYWRKILHINTTDWKKLRL